MTPSTVLIVVCNNKWRKTGGGGGGGGAFRAFCTFIYCVYHLQEVVIELPYSGFILQSRRLVIGYIVTQQIVPDSWHSCNVWNEISLTNGNGHLWCQLCLCLGLNFQAPM